MTGIAGLRCEACGAIAIPPALACHRCAGDLTPVDLPGEGAIHATTAIRVPMPDRSGEIPLVAPIAVVVLDAGPLIVARLDPALADSLPEIGARVNVDDAEGVLRVRSAG